MTKYKDYVKRMLDAEKEVFKNFKKLHDEYSLREDELQDVFNKEGAKILDIVNEWENRLCKQSESGGFSKFTPKLSESFRGEIKKLFPMIDHIGIQLNYTANDFVIKKITPTLD